MFDKKFGVAAVGFFLGIAAYAAPASASNMPTGVHWASTGDYQTLKNAGVDFVVTTVPPDDPAAWKTTLDAAETSGIKVIIGAYPSPYRLSAQGVWAISSNGTQFLHYLASRPSSVMGIFVYNEPYWVNPLTAATNLCGAMDAASLRALRTAIRAVWADAKIYHDLGSPGWWSPTGAGWSACIGDKYADQMGVADYVGVWSYPFTTSGFAESSSLADLRSEANYVRNAMKAIPIVLGQTFSLPSEHLTFPTADQAARWNCDLRTLPVGGISWYVWRQDIYSDYLANHPGYLLSLAGGACAKPQQVASTSRTASKISPPPTPALAPTSPASPKIIFWDFLVRVFGAACSFCEFFRKLL